MAAYPGSALPLAAGLRSLRLKHDSPMIHMRRGRRLEIAFVSYWEWAKLVATSLVTLLVHHSRGFFALVVAHKVGRIQLAPGAPPPREHYSGWCTRFSGPPPGKRVNRCRWPSRRLRDHRLAATSEGEALRTEGANHNGLDKRFGN